LFVFDRLLDHLLLLVRRERVGTDRRLSRAAAEQGFEDVAWLPRRIDAFGVVARDEVPAGTPGARLQIRQARLHPRNLPLDLAALGRRLGAEEQELLIVATDRMGGGVGAGELRALALGCGLNLPAAARRGRDR